jgi:fatty acid desaturase
MNIDIVDFVLQPLSLIGLILAGILFYYALRFLLYVGMSTKNQEDNESRAIMLAFGSVAVSYIYRLTSSIGWISIPLALLGGVLIILLSHTLLDERNDRDS